MFSSWYISHNIKLLFSEIAQGETTLKNHFWLSKHFFFTKMVFVSHFFFDIIDLKNILFHHQATNICVSRQSRGESVLQPLYTHFWPTFSFYLFLEQKDKVMRWNTYSIYNQLSGFPSVLLISEAALLLWEPIQEEKPQCCCICLLYE